MVVDSLGNIWVEDIDPGVDASYGDGRETVLRAIDATGAVKTVARNNRPTGSANANSYAGLTADGYGNVYELVDRMTVFEIGSRAASSGVSQAFSTLNPPVPGPDLPDSRSCETRSLEAQFHENNLAGVDHRGALYCAHREPLWGLFKYAAGQPAVRVARSLGPGWVDGDASIASYASMSSLVFDPNGNGYFVDRYSVPGHGSGTYIGIRRITQQGIFSTQFSNRSQPGYVDGGPDVALVNTPAELQVDGASNVYFSDTPLLDRTGTTLLYIRKLIPSGAVATVAGSFPVVSIGSGVPKVNFVVDAPGNIYRFDQSQLTRIAPDGSKSAFAGVVDETASQDGIGSQARFTHPLGVAADAVGNVYVADCGAHTVRKIDAKGNTTTLAGKPGESGNEDGIGAAARFKCPRAIVADAFGNLYVTHDWGMTWNGSLRKIDAKTGAVTTIAATRALTASGLAVDAAGRVYTNDLVNNALRVYDPHTDTFPFIAPRGFVYSVLNATSARGEFAGMTVDEKGNIYLIDPQDGKLRKVDSRGTVSDLYGAPGGGNVSNLPGAGGAMSFPATAGLAIDSAGNLYVADSWRHVIRKIAPDGTMITVAGVPSSYYAKPGALPGFLGSPVGIALRPGVSGTQLFVSDENSVLSIVLP
ncbi:MAG: hypothetical protein NT159_15380 [Proteobacteria bacterium]|nr:hypothetical protein [Pseudomonadota bacterium]